MRKLLMLISVGFIVFFARGGRSDDFVSYVSNGNAAPQFRVTRINGRPVDLEALKGKLVLLNFWATWCGPCQAELTHLQKEIWAKNKNTGLEIVAIGRGETNQTVSEFRKKFSFSFPMAADPDGRVYQKYANAGIPRNYLIGPDGKVLYQNVGYSPDKFEKLTRMIAAELDRMGGQGR